MYNWNDGTYLAHHGIKGQKWGLRRFQNDDGSLTPAGRERYGMSEKNEKVKIGINPRAQRVKEYAKDRKKRIKQESEAIKNSKVSNKEKAKALAKLGDHDGSAEYYQKDYIQKRKAKTIGNAAYSIGSKIASGVMANMVKNGMLNYDTGAKIAKSASVGRTIVNSYLNYSMLNDANQYNKEYWKFG